MIMDLLSNQTVLFRIVALSCLVFLLISYGVNRNMKSKREQQTFFQRHKKVGEVITYVSLFLTPIILLSWSIYTKDRGQFLILITMLFFTFYEIKYRNKENA
ncbi:hypothetical protein DX932_30325 [Bacillus cereus]|uniref:Uncharacterized protein n=2 Tax=Bacillus cereus group TaxID=86661 RepID=A0A9W7PZH1_BACCE|nr:hypothetical protein DX932_30325 [Bacillus cereus]PEQ70057.1 hypothetical protein CN474_17970 [Bacillus thuringiensis]